MMKHEFEQIAGYEVSDNDYYEIIEPMYMASNLDKQAFVETINKKRFALKPLKALVKEMKKIAAELEETCTHYTDYDKKDKLMSIAREYVDRKYGDAANYHIDEKVKQTCYYPTRVEIYSRRSYETIETLNIL